MHRHRPFPIAKLAALGLSTLVTFAAAASGEPPAQSLTGENLVQRSDGWKFLVGRWEWRANGGRRLLAQTGSVPAFAVALVTERRWQDADVTVRFRPISGEIDASGGIVFRAVDENNYYVVRANSLEDNFRLYTVVGGKRRQIAGVTIPKPALGEWHSLRVAVAGDRIRAYFNGERLIDHRDRTFSEGFVGLWTKADAVTEFGEMRVTPANARVDVTARAPLSDCFD